MINAKVASRPGIWPIPVRNCIRKEDTLKAESTPDVAMDVEEDEGLGKEEEEQRKREGGSKMEFIKC